MSATWQLATSSGQRNRYAVDTAVLHLLTSVDRRHALAKPNLMQPVLGNRLCVECGKLIHFLLSRHDVDLVDLNSKWRAPQSFVPDIQCKKDGQRDARCKKIGG